jgi:hypothetical protein
VGTGNYCTHPEDLLLTYFSSRILHRTLFLLLGGLKQSIKHIETMLVEAQTEKRDMSKASSAFATDLLDGLSISWRISKPIIDAGVGEPIDSFSWKQELLNGGTANISEPDGTPGALEWLFGKLSPLLTVDGKAVGVKDVKGKCLTPIKADGLQAKGKSDGCVARESDLALCEKTGESFYTYGMALVEMKTNRKSLNKAQMLLQLAAFSRESTWGRATVLLGTDGNKKWYLLYFEKYNSIRLTQYEDGRKCLEQFEYFLESIESRQADLEATRPKRARLDALHEEELEETVREQNLEGFSQSGVGLSPKKGGQSSQEEVNKALENEACLHRGQSSQEEVNKALENEAFLHRLANALAESGMSEGIRPTVPEWSLAKNKVPSYYM